MDTSLPQTTSTSLPDETDVLVVGGGVVGLATAVLLRRCGVAVELVERHPGTSIHPRAWGWYHRTLEILRSVDLEQPVLRAAEPYRDHRLNAKVVSLAGEMLSATELPDESDVGHLTPSRQISLGQDRLEPLLREAAEGAGAGLHFGHVAALPRDHGDRVVTTVTDRGNGRSHEVTSRWVVAADGARSPIRDGLGITRTGIPHLRDQVSILFRADLAPVLAGRRFSICQIAGERVSGVLGHSAELDGGTLILSCDERHGRRLEDFTPEHCESLVRAAIGDDSVAVTVVDVLPWQMSALVADQWVQGRVVLAGDACHVVPPIGGYGANTGIHDAHGLAWRLAAEIRGDAPASLVEQYRAERHRVAVGVVEQGRTRLAVRGGFATDEDRRLLRDPLWVTLGQAYAEDEPVFADPARRHAASGTRFPHAWLDRPGGTSTVDGYHWRLYARPGAASGLDGLPGPVDLRPVPDHLAQWWRDVCRAGEDTAVLVRPDGFVAARGEIGTDPTPVHHWWSRAHGATPVPG